MIHETERLVRGGGARRRSVRHLLLPGLHALQHRIGWISPGGLNHLCDRLQVPPAEAYGVATFYEMFQLSDPGRSDPVEHVCVDGPCRVAGALDQLRRRREEGARVHESPCLGQCERAPARFVQGVGSPDHVPDDPPGGAWVPGHPAAVRRAGSPEPRLLRRLGRVDPRSLTAYREDGGYGGLRTALEVGPGVVLDALDAAGLTGRGGAAFPTGVKWRAVANEPPGRLGRKHVVVNADESEPGTFKDRVVLEGDPFAVIEAMTIAAVTVGAEHGWIYVRGEYPLAAERLGIAVAAAREAGLLGTDVAGSGRSFDVEIRRGAGAYICGEETALFNSIEGHRGEPRNKPPYPTTQGLFREPTVVNNPETLLNVLEILDAGVDAYRSEGTTASPGRRLFCVSGHVAAPGVHEVPMGTPLADLLDRAGGATGTVGAVLLGGAAGSFVGVESLDVPLSLEDTRARGLTLGSGAVMVFDDATDFDDLVERIARFFRSESCGQCVPCRVGTVRQHEVLVEMRDRGSLSVDRRVLLDDIARAMADASICGLGHTAASAVRSAIELGLVGRDRSAGGGGRGRGRGDGGGGRGRGRGDGGRRGDGDHRGGSVVE